LIKKKIDVSKDPQHQLDYHWLWFVPIEDIVKTMGNPNYTLKDGKVIYKQRGRIQGKRGIKSYVTVEEHDLRTAPKSLNSVKFLE